MKIIVEFGYPGVRREVEWWRDIMDLPKKVQFDGEVWEFFMYDVADSGFDWHCYYTRSKAKGLGDTYVPRFEDAFCIPITTCQCGSMYTGFPQFHMFYCPKWSKV
jgi:hypothetical protein